MSSSIKGLRTRGLVSPFRSLLAMQFKVEFGLRGLSEKIGLGRSSRNAILYLGLMAFAFVPLIGMINDMGESIAVQSISIGQPGLPVVLIVMGAQFLVFFIGISALMSTLYYSNDLEMLQALPLSAGQILWAKLFPVYIAQMAISSALFVPFVLPLGMRVGGLAFWPNALLVNILIPALPLALSLLFTVAIMKVTKGARHRDALRVVFGLAFFALVMGFQYLNTTMIKSGPEEIMGALMRPNGLVQIAANYYPPLKWAAWAMTGWSDASGPTGMLAFTGVSVGLLVLLSVLGQSWFLGGVGTEVQTSGAPATSRKRGVFGRSRGAGAGTGGHEQDSATDVARAPLASGQETAWLAGRFSRTMDPLAAVLLRDHRTLVRTPNFLLVVLTNMAIVPILWVVTALGEQDLLPLINTLQASNIDAAVLIFAAIQGAIVSMNQVASTGISREGPTFWLSKMLPMPARVQIRSKIRYGMLVAVVQLATLIVTFYFLLKPDALQLAIAALLGMLASWPITLICTANDLFMPRLKWTQPHQAMKGNFATLGASLFSAVYLFGLGWIIRLIYKAGLTGLSLFALAAGALVGTGFALQRFVEGLAERKYAAIEV